MRSSDGAREPAPVRAPDDAIFGQTIQPVLNHIEFTPASHSCAKRTSKLGAGGQCTRGQFSPEAEVKRPKCLKSSTQVCVPTFSYSFLKSKSEIEIQGSTSFLLVRRQFKT